MKKRWLSLALVLCMALTLLPVSTFAAEIVKSGYCGDSVTYALDSDGLLTITGAGSITNYDYGTNTSPLFENEDVRSVRIDSGVTSIGDCLLYGCKNIVSASIPNSVTSIGDRAFSGCSSLMSVSIPGSVTSIGNGAFSSCSSLMSASIPSSVTSIGDSAFSGCSSLKSAEIPEGVRSIGKYAFGGCSKITSISIPASVTYIGWNPFNNCSNLNSIQVADDNPYYRAEQGVLLSKNGHELIGVPGALSGYFTVPSTVTIILPSAFSGCKLLQTVSIPESVHEIGEYAFRNCSSLTGVNIPASVTRIQTYCFAGCTGLTSITIPDACTEIEGNAFRECTNLRSVNIPDHVTAIGRDAFHCCESLASIHIPGSVTSMEDGAFSKCYSLTSVEIPSSIDWLKLAVFRNCTSLTTVIIPKSVHTIGVWAFDGCDNLRDVYYGGTEEEWAKVTIKMGNGPLKNQATIHCKDDTPIGQDDTSPNPPLSFSHSTYHVSYQRTFVIRAETNDAAWYDSSDVTWTSSNENAVKIRDTHVFTDGVTYLMAEVEGISDGTSTITLKTSDGRKASCIVTSAGYDTRIIPVQSIVLNGAYQISVGEITKLTTEVTPQNATDKHLTWKSSDPKIATVNSAGFVTGIGSGNVVITAVASSGVSEDYGIQVLSARDRLERGYQYADYRYAFFNNRNSFGYPSNYKIPLERYLQAGITKAKASVLSLGKWGGSCFGMSMSSALFASGALQAKNYTDIEAIAKTNVPHYLTAPSTNSRMDIKLRQMIELLQVSQRRADFIDTTFSVSKVVSELDAGNPVLLNLHDGHVQHTVVLSGYEKNGQTYTFSIYDCSGFVNKLQYNSSGDYSFEYADESYHWKIDSFDSLYTLEQILGRIKNSNVQGSSMLLKARKKDDGSIAEKELYFIVNAKEVQISDLNGNSAEISNGEWLGNIAARLIRTDNLSDESIYSIIVPSNSYSITSAGMFSAADDVMSIDVIAPENSATTISEDLHTICFTCADGDSFSATYTTYDNLLDELTVSGTASGPVEISLSEDNQSATITGAASVTASASVSGETSEVSSESSGETITVQCVETGNGTQLQLLSGMEPLSDSVTLAVRQQTAVPSYDLESGTYDEGQLLTFTKDDDTLIYYTLDGSEPTENAGLLYTLPIEITKSVTVKAMAVKYGYTPSNVVTLEYSLPFLYSPIASVIPGNYDKALYVDLNAKEDAQIYYTTDGSDPKENGILFGASIALDENATIRTYCVKDGLVSNVISYSYKIDIPVQSNPFTDVPDGKFFTDAVLWAVSHDPQITTGVTDTTFMPDRVCTRAHVVTFLWRANGCPEPKSTTNTFKDVPNGKYYTKAVLWASEQGITTGYADGTFRPDAECTRAQVVTFLWRANGSPKPERTDNPFKDVSSSAYYAKAVLWALETGVTTGKTATAFNPDGECTRAHVVTFLYRDMA